MAYNRYKDVGKSTGLEMTDIPGMKHNPYIDTLDKKDESTSGSPMKPVSSKAAEVFSQDIVKSNEAKIRHQILFNNNQGVMGPVIELDKTRPAPKSPTIGMGASAYNLHFSPGKKRDELPLKLQNSKLSYNPLSYTSKPSGLRHISNQDAYIRGHYMGSSMDYSKSHKNMMPLINPGVSKGRQVTYEKANDHFRFKKNLTTNADRILTHPPDGYIQTPDASTSSKYEEIRKAAISNFATEGSVNRNMMGKNSTFDHSNAQENINYNIPKYSARQPSPIADK